MNEQFNGTSGFHSKRKGNVLSNSGFGLKSFSKNKTRSVILTGVLMSVTVVLTRLLAIQTPVVRVSLEFIPIVITAVLFGPVIGGLAAGLSDIIGMLVLPAGPYFPGFTLNAAITGIVYGLFLYGREIRFKNVLLCVLINIILVDFILISIWIHTLYQIPYEVIVVTRLIKCSIMYPVQVLTIYYGVNAIKKSVRIEGSYE